MAVASQPGAPAVPAERDRFLSTCPSRDKTVRHGLCEIVTGPFVSTRLTSFTKQKGLFVHDVPAVRPRAIHKSLPIFHSGFEGRDIPPAYLAVNTVGQPTLSVAQNLNCFRTSIPSVTIEYIDRQFLRLRRE